jgi:hypothetical protein
MNFVSNLRRQPVNLALLTIDNVCFNGDNFKKPTFLTPNKDYNKERFLGKLQALTIKRFGT